MLIVVTRLVMGMELEVDSHEHFKQACEEAELSPGNFTYYGGGIWFVSTILPEQISEMIVTPNFIIEDSIAWLNRKMDDPDGD